MDPLDPEEVAAAHIKLFHNRMPGTGELRFRLMNTKDKSAYIRTVAGPKGAWQESHFHTSIKETYIVQHGWMLFAYESRKGSGRAVYEYYDANSEPFTTSAGIIHTVYLPPLAEIHTVKHGDAVNDSGEEEVRAISKETKAFDAVVAETHVDALRADLSARQGRQNIAGDSKVSVPTQRYNEGYRHFDNLIWQLPAWSAAIFALSIQGLPLVMDAKLSGLLGAPSRVLGGTFMALMALFQVSITFSVYRFRIHQVLTKTHRPGRAMSAQAAFQFMTSLLAAAMAVIAVRLLAPSAWLVQIAFSATPIYWAVWSELQVWAVHPADLPRQPYERRDS